MGNISTKTRRIRNGGRNIDRDDVLSDVGPCREYSGIWNIINWDS